MRDYAEILPIYEQRWAERPDSYYFIPLANAYRAAGQPHQAIGVLQQGLERHPDSLSGRAALAAAYLEAGLHTGAEEEAQRILAAQPENLLIGRLLVACYREAGRLEEALTETQRLLELAPHDDRLQETLQELEGHAAERAEEVAPAPPPATVGEEQASQEALDALVDDTAAMEEIHSLFPSESPPEEDRTAHIITTLGRWLDALERRRGTPPARR